MKQLASLSLLILTALTAVSPAAKAGIILTMQEVGSDVVLTSAGTLGPVDGNVVNVIPDKISAAMTPAAASLTVGTGLAPSGNNAIRYIDVLSGPLSFGPGTSSNPTTTTGPIFAFVGVADQLAVDAVQVVTSQDITAGTSTWSATTLAALGVTPGTYTWTVSGAMLASGNDDTVVLNILDPTFDLTIVKEAVGGDDTFDFASTVNSDIDVTAFNLTTASGTAQMTLTDLPAGFLEIEETAPAGWELTDIECVGVTDDDWASNFPRARLIASPGDDITCTFTNTKKDTLTIVKQSTGGDGDFEFTSAALGNFTLATVNGTASQSFANLSAGTYDVAETVPDGWALTGAACSNGDSPGSVTLGAGEVVTCTFENEKLDAITVVKRTVGGDGAFDFASSTLGDFTLVTKKGEAKTTFSDLNPGVYDIAEILPSGWEQSNAPVCSNGDDPSSITLAAGERVICTFDNRKQDTLVIAKETTGGDGSFDFTSDIPGQGSFSLTTFNGAASVAFDNLTPGTYSVSETLPSGWSLTEATCDNGDSPDSVTLDAGETVACTFANTREDTLVLVTEAVGADGRFAFTSTTLSPASFDLQTVNGQATRVFDNLAPGSYDLTENTPSGWTLASATCDNGDDPSAVDLGVGETVTCTFLNLRNDTLIIEKQATGGDRSFSFSSTQAALGDFNLTTANGFASRSFANLVPGIYNVVETVPDGWDLTDATCDNGDTPDNINLAAGRTVTCTFANKRTVGPGPGVRPEPIPAISLWGLGLLSLLLAAVGWSRSR